MFEFDKFHACISAKNTHIIYLSINNLKSNIIYQPSKVLVIIDNIKFHPDQITGAIYVQESSQCSNCDYVMSLLISPSS